MPLSRYGQIKELKGRLAFVDYSEKDAVALQPRDPYFVSKKEDR